MEMMQSHSAMAQDVTPLQTREQGQLLSGIPRALFGKYQGWDFCETGPRRWMEGWWGMGLCQCGVGVVQVAPASHGRKKERG